MRSIALAQYRLGIILSPVANPGNMDERRTVHMDSTTADSIAETLLSRWRAGDDRASDELMNLLYRELRGLAEHRLRMSPGHSLVPTELVHEAFLKLARSPNHTWESRCHFINAAGTAMRSVLVDRARAKQTIKRSAPTEPLLSHDLVRASEPELDSEMILKINEAVSALEEVDARAARVVTLRFFAGLTEPEIAGVLGVNERTIRRDWLFARAWLKRSMESEPESPGRHAP
jgi:RNA polymerase sigma factor (TIGR02999 family)